MTIGQQPAGWYPDPQSPNSVRYWDGAAWTQQTAPAPVPMAPPAVYGWATPLQGMPKRGTNGLAIASMILGIVWVWGIGSILALIFGYVALNQIKHRNESGRGMAIAGTVLGWVGVLFTALVIVGIVENH